MNPKALAIIGGILVIAGAFAPWASFHSSSRGVSRYFYGYESDGLITGLAGLIILVVGIGTTMKPSKLFSFPIVSLSVLAGLVTVMRLWTIYSAIGLQPVGVRASIDYGLNCLTPLGLAFAFLAGVTRMPKENPRLGR